MSEQKEKEQGYGGLSDDERMRLKKLLMNYRPSRTTICLDMGVVDLSELKKWLSQDNQAGSEAKANPAADEKG